jgi:hypothetical protein
MAAPSAIRRIRTGGPINNPALKTQDQRSYDLLLPAAAPGMIWFTPKKKFMTLIDTSSDPDAALDEVAAIANRVAGSTTNFAKQSSLQAPHWIESDPAFGGRSSIQHDTGGPGDVLLFSGAAPILGDFTKIVLVQIDELPATGSGYFLSSSTTSGDRHLTSVTATQFLHRVGASGSEALSIVPSRAGRTCLWQAWDDTAKSVGQSIDLGRTWSAPVVNLAADTTDTSLVIGGTANFRWRHAMLVPLDLRKLEAVAVAQLFARFFRDIEGYVV